jgi:hypothetical protein
MKFDSNCSLSVAVPPKLMVDRDFQDVIIMKTNSSKIIEVPFVASPMPKVTWAYNDGKIPDTKRITEQTIRGMTSLTISRAVRTDAGDYTLKIENKFGTVNLSVKVKVLGKFSCLVTNLKNGICSSVVGQK